MSGNPRYIASGAVYPLLPAQLGNNAGLRPGEPSGEILCPVKRAAIAVMRCGEWQDTLGCGDGCAAKAARDDIERARNEVKHFEPGAGGGTYTCLRCGGAKLCVQSGLCMSCGNVESNKRRVRGHNQ